MGRYNRYERQEIEERPWVVHPIWRGIGFILIILIPILSYAGAVLFVEANARNNWFAMPVELAGPAQFPYLFAHLLFGVLFAIGGFGIVTMIYAFVYQIIGPPKYGPLDAPPPKKRRKRRR